jgi:hypothetical protein
MLARDAPVEGGSKTFATVARVVTLGTELAADSRTHDAGVFDTLEVGAGSHNGRARSDVRKRFAESSLAVSRISNALM